MNKKLILLTGIALFGAMHINASIIKFSIANAGENSSLIINFNNTGEKEIVTLDASGKGELKVKNNVAQYAFMQFRRTSRRLFLDPKSDLTITFDANSYSKSVSFQGEGKDINNYLNTGKIIGISANDTKLDENAFMAKTDSVYEANLKTLKSSHFQKPFVDLESSRLKYLSYGILPNYVKYHKYFAKDNDFVASDKYYNKLKSLLVFKSDLLAIPEYKEFLKQAVVTFSDNGQASSIARAENNLKYIESNVTDKHVAEYLVDFFVNEHVKYDGLDDTENLVAFYHKYVHDTKMVSNFERLSSQWEKLRRGNPSPSFVCQDINGKEVKLSDLKGKYVYIDVWATWCGPCKGELPFLKKLEEKYHDKDIHFVSISCDSRKKSWEDMVKKENLKGIQLILGKGNSFMDDYIIRGIPRFILLDKQNNIISSNMTRPSDPETEKRFEELLTK